MPTTLDQLKSHFAHAVRGLFPDLYDADVPVVPTTNPAFGDYQCNAPMALAKRLKQKPRDVATALMSAIGDLGGMAEKVEIAGPGFINVTLADRWVEGELAAAGAHTRLGIGRADHPRTTVLDYPSPNIAKEMHIGHLRPCNIGDAIARTLDFAGDNLIRQNHVGDWGTAFGMLLAYLEATDGRSDAALADIEQLYKAAKKRFDDDPAFKDAARIAVVRLQAGEAVATEHWQTIIGISRAHMREMFARLNLTVRDADERGESFYNPRLSSVVADLLAKGVAEPSEGATAVWVKPFETPMIVRKSDGGYGYATTDLAALWFRTNELKAERIIVVTDARQRQHFQMFLDAGRRAGYLGEQQFDHVMFGAILGGDNKPIKTKSGESVKLTDVLDEAVRRAEAVVVSKNPDLPEADRQAIAKAVGIGAVKYFDLNKDRTTDYVFDWDTMLSLDGNTAVYLLYAYARIRSILRKSDGAAATGTIVLTAAEEKVLGRHLLKLGEVVTDVARDLKPHLLCQYLYELATKFSGFYEACPVLKSDEPMRSSRLALCDLTARTLALGLDLLGIAHPEQM